MTYAEWFPCALVLIGAAGLIGSFLYAPTDAPEPMSELDDDWETMR